MRSMVSRAILFTLILTPALVALVQLDSVPLRSQKTVAEQPARHASRAIPEATKQQVVAAYGKMPLSFEANQGQTDSRVKFLSRGRGYTLFLTSTEAVLTLRSPRAKPPASDHGAAIRPEPPAERDVLRIRLVGANPAPQMTGLDALPGKSNYFIGKDPQKWRKNVPHYAKVNYEEVYPGIDLVFYGSQRRLEYDFVVAPGGDPGAIALGFEGTDRLEIDPQGDLVVHMAGGAVRFQKPLVYQELDGTRQIVPGHYTFKSDDRVGFQVAAYDATKPLVVDPVLVYSTYLGGSDHDAGRAIAVDVDGNAYVAGSTKSTDFPTKDPIQANNAGGYDVFVTKLNVDGSALVYSTYIGGTQHAHAIAVDSFGNAYVTGLTGSADLTNFPTTAGAFQEQDPGGNSSAFVTKLSDTGGLVYSTFLGGNSSDKGLGIAVDSFGNAYVTGGTSSVDDPNTPEDEGFPTASPLQTTNAGGADAFVAVLNDTGTGLHFSTYLGGSHRDEGLGIAVDGGGNAYVTGVAYSNDFPTTNGAFDINCGANDDNSDCGLGKDYEARSGTVVISAGQTSATITVPTIDDHPVSESPENFFVDLTAATVGIADGQGVGTIVDPEESPRVSINDVKVIEGEEASFTVRLSARADDDVVVSFETADGSAIAGDDYVATSGTVVISAGQTSATITVPTIEDTDLDTEKFFVNLTLTAPTVDIADGQGVGTIVDPEEPPVVSINDVTVTEGERASFTVRLSARADADVMVSFATRDGSAKDGVGDPVGPDAFVARLDTTGVLCGTDPDSLCYSTFLGGHSRELGRGIAVDGGGNAYVTGQTSSVDDPNTPEDEGFPTTLGAVQGAHGGVLYNIFVTKLDPTGSGLVYSTYLSSYSEGWGIALDGLNNAYVTGIAMDDVFVAKLNPEVNGPDGLLFFTAVGGESTDKGLGIAVDSFGNAYVTGVTFSSDFPTTEGAFQTRLGGTSPKRGGPKYNSSSDLTGDAFIVKIVEDLPGITLTATPYKVKGLQKVDLEWSGLTPRVGIYRDGELKAWTSNPGFYTDNIDQKGGGTYIYQVCEEENPTMCSDKAEVTF